MNLLDMRTIVVGMAVSNTICFLVFVLLWRQNRQRFAGLGFLLAHFVLQCLGAVLMALRGVIPDFYSIVVANAMYIGGIILLYFGLERFVGKPGSQYHNYVLFGIFVAVHAYFTHGHDNLLARNINTSIVISIICFQCAWLLLYRTDAGLRPVTRLAGVIFVIYFLISLLRIPLDLFVSAPGNEFMNSTIFNVLVVLSYQMFFIGLTFSFLLMVNHHLINSLQKDILERQSAETALLTAAQEWRTTFDSVSDGICLLDAEMRIRRANKAMANIFGVPVQTVAGQRCHALVHGTDAPIIECPVERARRTHARENLELQMGSRYLDVTADPILDAHGEIQGFVHNLRDITERKEMERNLAESEAFSRAILENSPIGISVRSHTGQLLLANQAWKRIWAIPDDVIREDMQRVRPKLEFNQRDNYLKAHYAELQRVYEQGGHLYLPDLEVDQPRPNAAEWVSQYFYALQDVDGKVKQVVILTEDITKRKHAECQIHELNANLEKRVEERTAQLRDAQEKLLRQEKLALLGQLAGGVGHELRNPLGVITNALYFLNLIQPDASPKVKEYLQIIQQETRAADKIISDLLEFSRLKAVDFAPVPTRELIQNALQRYPAPANVSVSVELPTETTFVFVDPRQILQVLGNLLVNAYQAMEQGGQLFITQEIVRQDSREMAALLLRDTGVGIHQKHLTRIFEPLFTTKPKGIGLGLAVCKKLVEANCGQIHVDSRAGQGTTFTLTMPIAERDFAWNL